MAEFGPKSAAQATVFENIRDQPQKAHHRAAILTTNRGDDASDDLRARRAWHDNAESAVIPVGPQFTPRDGKHRPLERHTKTASVLYTTRSFSMCRQGQQVRATVRLIKQPFSVHALRLAICTKTNLGECHALLGHYGCSTIATDRRPTCAVGGRVTSPHVVLATHVRMLLNIIVYSTFCYGVVVQARVPEDAQPHLNLVFRWPRSECDSGLRTLLSRQCWHSRTHSLAEIATLPSKMARTSMRLRQPLMATRNQISGLSSLLGRRRAHSPGSRPAASKATEEAARPGSTSKAPELRLILRVKLPPQLPAFLSRPRVHPTWPRACAHARVWRRRAVPRRPVTRRARCSAHSKQAPSQRVQLGWVQWPCNGPPLVLRVRLQPQL